ncbi:MAG: response regulator [Luteolibacter sp.]
MAGPNHIQIAIIDDDESLCRSMGRLLRAVSFESKAYTSAEQFLADPDRPRFDCILLDIQLEGISGLELHEKLVREGDRTPVVFITAHDAPEVRHHAETTGCAGYFHKSDSGLDVVSAILRVVGGPSSSTATGGADETPSWI